jgi:hypothetical protein
MNRRKLPTQPRASSPTSSEASGSESQEKNGSPQYSTPPATIQRAPKAKTVKKVRVTNVELQARLEELATLVEAQGRALATQGEPAATVRMQETPAEPAASSTGQRQARNAKQHALKIHAASNDHLDDDAVSNDHLDEDAENADLDDDADPADENYEAQQHARVFASVLGPQLGSSLPPGVLPPDWHTSIFPDDTWSFPVSEKKNGRLSDNHDPVGDLLRHQSDLTSGALRTTYSCQAAEWKVLRNSVVYLNLVGLALGQINAGLQPVDKVNLNSTTLRDDLIKLEEIVSVWSRVVLERVSVLVVAAHHTSAAADKLSQKFRAKTMGLLPEAASFAADLPPPSARPTAKRSEGRHDNNNNNADNNYKKSQSRSFRGKGKQSTSNPPSAPQHAGADDKK